MSDELVDASKKSSTDAPENQSVEKRNLLKERTILMVIAIIEFIVVIVLVCILCVNMSKNVDSGQEHSGQEYSEEGNNEDDATVVTVDRLLGDSDVVRYYNPSIKKRSSMDNIPDDAAHPYVVYTCDSSDCLVASSATHGIVHAGTDPYDSGNWDFDYGVLESPNEAFVVYDSGTYKIMKLDYQDTTPVAKILGSFGDEKKVTIYNDKEWLRVVVLADRVLLLDQDNNDIRVYSRTGEKMMSPSAQRLIDAGMLGWWEVSPSCWSTGNEKYFACDVQSPDVTGVYYVFNAETYEFAASDVIETLYAQDGSPLVVGQDDFCVYYPEEMTTMAPVTRKCYSLPK